MGVFRVKKTENYTVMSNYHFRDKRLSFKAKGLLSFMLSLPDDWDYSVQGLVGTAKDGRDSITSGLKELEHFGYLKREPIKEKGIIKDWNYIIFEQPASDTSENEQSAFEFSESTENSQSDPYTDFPEVDFPEVENPKQINTKSNKYINNNNIYISSISENESPKVDENHDTESESFDKVNKAINEFEEIWKLYPKKIGKAKARDYYIAWTTKGRKLKTNNYRLKKLNKEEVEEAIKNYNLEVISNNREYQFIKNADTFFNTAILDYINLKKQDLIKNSNKRTSSNEIKDTYKNYNQRSYEQRDYSSLDLDKLYANSWIK